MFGRIYRKIFSSKKQSRTSSTKKKKRKTKSSRKSTTSLMKESGHRPSNHHNDDSMKSVNITKMKRSSSSSLPSANKSRHHSNDNDHSKKHSRRTNSLSKNDDKSKNGTSKIYDDNNSRMVKHNMSNWLVNVNHSHHHHNNDLIVKQNNNNHAIASLKNENHQDNSGHIPTKLPFRIMSNNSGPEHQQFVRPFGRNDTNRGYMNTKSPIQSSRPYIPSLLQWPSSTNRSGLMMMEKSHHHHHQHFQTSNIPYRSLVSLYFSTFIVKISFFIFGCYFFILVMNE